MLAVIIYPFEGSQINNDGNLKDTEWITINDPSIFIGSMAINDKIVFFLLHVYCLLPVECLALGMF